MTTESNPPRCLHVENGIRCKNKCHLNTIAFDTTHIYKWHPYCLEHDAIYEKQYKFCKRIDCDKWLVPAAFACRFHRPDLTTPFDRKLYYLGGDHFRARGEEAVNALCCPTCSSMDINELGARTVFPAILQKKCKGCNAYFEVQGGEYRSKP